MTIPSLLVSRRVSQEIPGSDFAKWRATVEFVRYRRQFCVKIHYGCERFLQTVKQQALG